MPVICEYEFEAENPKMPDYSKREVDYYGASSRGRVGEHRLSLRKILKTGLFEVYREYFRGLDNPRHEVVFQGSLQEAVSFACAEWSRVWGPRESDKICQHKPPVQSLWCPLRKRD